MPARKPFRVVLTALAVLGAVTGHGSADTDDLLADLEAIQREEHLPAIGLVIVERSTTLVRAWGRTGNPAKPEADGDTPFRLGSITKTFTALALVELARSRNLDLDTPLDKVVGPGSHVNPFPGQPVRLRHLVEHTAGLGDLTRAEFDHNEPDPVSLVRALAIAPESRRVRWPPGTRHSYTNVGPGLVSLAIERVSGESFESYTTHAVLQPLGMTRAGFFPDAALPKGYRDDGVTEIPYWHMTFRAYGALNATPNEMGRFLTALVDRGRLQGRQVIPASSWSGLLRPVSTLAARAGLSIGYGFGAYGWVSHGHVFRGHGGDADGFRSRYGVLREPHRAYFVVINADHPRALERLRDRIELHLTHDLDAPTLPDVPRIGAPALSRWAGGYYPSSARFRLQDWSEGRLPRARVTVSHRGLRFTGRGRPVNLVVVSDHLFRREGDPLATVAFIEHAGCVHLQGELGNFVRLEASEGEAFQNRCISE